MLAPGQINVVVVACILKYYRLDGKAHNKPFGMPNATKNYGK